MPWILIVAGAVSCGVILYGIFTQTWDKGNTVTTFVFASAAICLLFGLWVLLRKKRIEYININGWQYKLFQSVSKGQFILIFGGISALKYVAVLLCTFFFKIVPLRDGVTPRLVLLVTGMSIVIAAVFGYIQHKKCSSVDMDSEFDAAAFKL
ncbi:MAG: hypothetical protein LBH61_00325 [Dysgonamonadaceae bacterium]|nr:hypothetical protein [Dysgonamonadaceae bacterium]